MHVAPCTCSHVLVMSVCVRACVRVASQPVMVIAQEAPCRTLRAYLRKAEIGPMSTRDVIDPSLKHRDKDAVLVKIETKANAEVKETQQPLLEGEAGGCPGAEEVGDGERASLAEGAPPLADDARSRGRSLRVSAQRSSKLVSRSSKELKTYRKPSFELPRWSVYDQETTIFSLPLRR